MGVFSFKTLGSLNLITPEFFELLNSLLTPLLTSFPKVSTPWTGLITAPNTPVPTPLKKPNTPSFLYSSWGLLTIPATPSVTVLNPFLIPEKTPPKNPLGSFFPFNTLLLLFDDILVLVSIVFVFVGAIILVAFNKLPVTFPKESAVPPIIFDVKLLTPVITPIPNSFGPFVNFFLGSLNNS